MKRLRLLVVVGVIAAALPLGMSAVGASGTTSTVVSIQSPADYDVTGTNVDVRVNVRCTGGTGTLVVELKQYPPETPYPVGEGSGPNIVACDGTTHAGGATVIGAVFDPGRALATATVVAPSGTKTVSKWIHIVQ
jgi:hypothetical protein